MKPHAMLSPRITVALHCCAVFLFGVGCARTARPVASAQPVAEAEPIHDTIQEFRRGERIACAQGTDLVYVVSRDGGLHSFDPTELRFRRIGTLECPGTRGSQPHSMAVDRSGQAWIGYDNGVLALASILDAECTPSRVNVRAARIGRRFGMGFAPTPEGGIGGETLFLTTEPPLQDLQDGRIVRGNSLLARSDDGTSVTIAGQFPSTLRGLSGELSSRSDGRLFAFFTGDPFQLAEIDPATADLRWQKRLEGMRFSESGSGSWAFSAVGSEFFFFWADRNAASTVTRLREDGTLEHVIENAGMEIVGAGASTCASAKTPAAKPRPEAPKPEAEPPKVNAPAEAQKVPSKTIPASKLPPLPPPNVKTPLTPSRPKPRVRPRR